jgi:hypothetical protein
MEKKIAILQSNYIPWKGYFDIINMADEFIFYDHVQYTKNDWRNRNRIKTHNGIKWLTIPVSIQSASQQIRDTKISDKRWNIKHWKTISQEYAKSKYFKEYKDFFENLYLSSNEVYLSEINYKFIVAINSILGLKTSLSWSMDYNFKPGKNEALIELCKQAKCTTYISGPSAKKYIEEDLFAQNGIDLFWMDYSHYPEYYQLFPPFNHFVSIIDLIFNEGVFAKKFMIM